jgi:hypothetical protein
VHHPGDLRVGASQVLQLGFFGGLVLSFMGKNVLPERVANVISGNPMGTFGTLLLMNVASGKLVNTGAFEVSYQAFPGADPVSCWSKLEVGLFPTMEVLAENVRAASAASRPQIREDLTAASKVPEVETLRDEL